MGNSTSIKQQLAKCTANKTTLETNLSHCNEKNYALEKNNLKTYC